MRTANRHAFKEWAAVAEAIVAGRQAVIFRKGGIHERRGEFAVEQDEFWLFPTRFHQDDGELTAEGRGFLADASDRMPEPGLVAIREYVVVTDMLPILREDLLPHLRPFHVYDDRVLDARFRYRTPGLTAIVVRAFVRPEPIVLPDSPHFAGCRSWVDLPDELPTAGLRPALDEAAFGTLRRAIAAAIAPAEFA